MRKALIPAAILTLSLAACGGNETADDTMAADDAMATEDAAPAGGMTAIATLMTADGTNVGTATATGSIGGITIDIEGMNMPEGMHGVHVHETGTCEGDFSSAGGHWNPDGATHGLESGENQHAGDMPNLEVAADGSGTLSYMLAPSATFEGLMDGDGSAFIVHAGQDDQTTDPSGDSGDRIACGVFQAS